MQEDTLLVCRKAGEGSNKVNENSQHFIHEINTIAYDDSDVNLFLRKLMRLLRKNPETVVRPIPLAITYMLSRSTFSYVMESNI